MLTEILSRRILSLSCSSCKTILWSNNKVTDACLKSLNSMLLQFLYFEFLFLAPFAFNIVLSCRSRSSSRSSRWASISTHYRLWPFNICWMPLRALLPEFFFLFAWIFFSVSTFQFPSIIIVDIVRPLLFFVIFISLFHSPLLSLLLCATLLCAWDSPMVEEVFRSSLSSTRLFASPRNVLINFTPEIEFSSYTRFALLRSKH